MTDKQPDRQADEPRQMCQQVESLLSDFEAQLSGDDLRLKVLALVSVVVSLRDLGKSLIPADITSARARILYYFQKHPGTIISGNELLVVSGIQEYARRVRELRVEHGWSIATGVTMQEMRESDDGQTPEMPVGLRPDDYMMLSTQQDRDAAQRWSVANTIRKSGDSVRDKILCFLRVNAGSGVTGEELRYVAGDKTEWARRVRELRTEHGWPVATKSTGRPDLPVGVYVLQADRQSPEHDRRIPDDVRREVLRRDGYRCTECGWSHDLWNPSDPRHLEPHHVRHHAHGGDNEASNLITLCNICHDVRHAGERKAQS